MIKNHAVTGHGSKGFNNSGWTAENKIIEQTELCGAFPQGDKYGKYKNLTESDKLPATPVIIYISLLISADRLIHLNHPTIG